MNNLSVYEFMLVTEQSEDVLKKESCNVPFLIDTRLLLKVRWFDEIS